jgi:D-alanine-D-alanine ligase
MNKRRQTAKRKKLRIIVLMHELLVPPDSLTGYSDEEMMEWKTEFDVVTTLRELGHEVTPIGVSDELSVIQKAIRNLRPHVAFNLLEEFHGVGVYDQHVVSYLELKKLHYTGCNPRGLMLSHDKPLSKKILSYHRIRTPGFFVAQLGRKPRMPARFEFPLLVKSVTEDASLGISNSSVVRDEKQLFDQIDRIHSELATDALVEAFIEGRELYVGALGNRRINLLPIWELRFKKAPAGTQVIATSQVKWDLDFQKKMGVATDEATDLDSKTTEKINSVCRRVFRALSLSGYARMDLRLTEDNEVYVLEANPNPNLSFGEDFAESAERAGYQYEALLQKILTLGLSYQAEWRLV